MIYIYFERRREMPLSRIVLLCACAAMLLCGCDKQENDSAPAEDKTQRVTSQVPASPVEVKEYKFPEFLASEDTDDMLSNVISPPFDSAAAVVKADIGELGKYKPILCIFGEYYTFREEGRIGILNKDGGVLVRAESFVDAQPVSNHVIKLDYPPEENKKPELLFVNGGMGKMINSGYDSSKVWVDETETEDGKKICSLNVFGIKDQRKYDSIVPVKPGEIKTSVNYAAAFKAVSGSKKYYIILDDYYNITVCEGVYGKISLKAGGKYGECFILDGDHYNEVYKMITSFGSASDQPKPSKEEQLDFVQITFGTDTADKTVVTVSSEGFCLRDTVQNSGQTVNKYFSVFPKETFTDLVNWVGNVASQEYASGRAQAEAEKNKQQ